MNSGITGKNAFPKKEAVDVVKQLYPAGCRVEFINMKDSYATIPLGTKGTVTYVDDIGTIHVHWDSGHHLGIAYGEDECRRLPIVGSEGSDRERYAHIYQTQNGDGRMR